MLFRGANWRAASPGAKLNARFLAAPGRKLSAEDMGAND